MNALAPALKPQAAETADPPLRVLTFLHSFEPGGVERVALRLHAAWRASGCCSSRSEVCTGSCCQRSSPDSATDSVGA